MKLGEILSIVEGTVIAGNADLNVEITCSCGADLMSDVLIHAISGSVLLTGLTNPQVVRTVEMAEIRVIVLVRGKVPPSETIALAEEKAIPLIATRFGMFEICGRLFAAGMESCDVSS